jgi:hypothetical protein
MVFSYKMFTFHEANTVYVWRSELGIFRPQNHRVCEIAVFQKQIPDEKSKVNCIHSVKNKCSSFLETIKKVTQLFIQRGTYQLSPISHK